MAHLRGEFKEDLAKTEAKLSDKINNVEVQVAHVKSELKEEIAASEAKVSGKINNVETKLSDKINNVEAQVAHVKSELKEEMGKFIEMILQGQLKARESSKVQTRWVVGDVFAVMGLILTVLGLIVTFYIRFIDNFFEELILPG